MPMAVSRGATFVMEEGRLMLQVGFRLGQQARCESLGAEYVGGVGPALADERRRLGILEQLGEQLVLEGHEVQVLELEHLVLVGIGVRLKTAPLHVH